MDESRIGDGEEETAEATGLQDFDIDPFGKDGDLAPADQSLVACLGEQRLTDREQHDHHGDADAITGEQEYRAPRTEREVAQREQDDHGAAARDGTSPGSG